MITKEEIKKLADLARIRLDEKEIDSLRGDIDNILIYVGEISNLKTQDVLPWESANKNSFREDIPLNQKGVFREALLENAPKKDGKYFKVKKIL